MHVTDKECCKYG